ncbi:hypothetical protein QFZ20_000645 [Flavobacterium sp. W4I14]|nr:hypothetical protein [Flavobacterium sp. W4I14]
MVFMHRLGNIDHLMVSDLGTFMHAAYLQFSSLLKNIKI